MKPALIFLIRCYQKVSSAFLPGRCRFYPSCSEYAVTAIDKKGVIKGVALSMWRVIRCNPYLPCGYDPVE